MGYQDASGRRLNYGTYLHLDRLLTSQDGLTDAHDELLFIVVHQAYELWFKEMIHELEGARSVMEGGDSTTAVHCLRRVAVIERLLVEQVAVLETMRPQDFLSFRSRLAPASGFQSAQFREIEFISGLKQAPGRVQKLDVGEAEKSRLLRRLNEPSLGDAFYGLLERRGIDDLIELYRDSRPGDLFELAEALLDHDEGFSLWRLRHIEMVERQIGQKPGTGGSTGIDYLRSTLGQRFFPQLWEVRSRL
jgi:tryptophan 2,3-dioxygenase